MSSNVKQSLLQALASRVQRDPTPIEGDFAQALARRLEQRGIAKVPGLPVDEPTTKPWYEVAIEHDRRTDAAIAQRQAEDQALSAPRTAAGILSAAVAGSSNAIPLNGAAVLRAALAGGSGTINGAIE